MLDITPKPPVRRAWAITRTCEFRSPATEAMLEILHKQAGRLSRRSKAA